MSLASLKSPGDLEAEILMGRTAFSGSFLIVEGDDDSRFFRNRVATASCEIVNAGGKRTVIGAVERLNGHRFRGALGVVDDDCDSIDGRHVPQPNLLTTGECWDLDALLVWSPALDRFLAEHASPLSLQRFGGVGAVRSRMAEIALPFGALRRWSIVAGAGLDFKDLGPMRFVNPSWELDISALYSEAATRLAIGSSSLEANVAALPQANPRALCHGPDLIAILARGLEKNGILGPTTLRLPQIGPELRLALEDTSWRSTKLAQDIGGWEAANPPYQVLRGPVLPLP